MKTTMFALSILFLISAVSFSDQPIPRESAEGEIASMTWLAGDWIQDGFEAHYTNPEGEKIFSISRYFKDGECVFFELEKFEIQDGVVVVVPYPKGKESVPFRLQDSYDPRAKKAAFTNPDHDWPTQLSYELVSPDNLLILVSGMQNGKMRIERFDLTRKK